jgi:hypothetical protein
LLLNERMYLAGESHIQSPVGLCRNSGSSVAALKANTLQN